MENRILHLDIDAFFASVEQIRNPKLREKPVIVGNGCIASCSYEARKSGLYAGQGLSEARQACPGVVILDGNYSVYRCFADRVWEICRDFSPDIDTFLDDAYLDLTGSGRVHGGMLGAGNMLKERIRRETGLSVTCGIGPSRVVARMASKAGKPDGLTLVEPGESRSFLAGFPVGDLPGVGWKSGQVLRKLNVETVGELQALPREGLQSLFGALGLAIYERARGRDSMVITGREIPKSISRETAFHRETTNPDESEGMLYYLTERIGSTLRSLGCAARNVRVKIGYSDGVHDRASRSLPEPSDRDGDLYEAALAVLRKIHSRRVALYRIGIRVSRIAPAARLQRMLFENARDRLSESLLLAVDTVRNRYGFSALVAGNSLNLLGKLKQDSYGYVLRTPSLTK
ncbi:MAG: DNA polymerase Y family protein [Planctomycetota bacterium]|jgi:DNA polymerase-4